MASVKFLSGTYAQYVSLTQKSDDTLYFLDNGLHSRNEPESRPSPEADSISNAKLINKFQRFP